MTDPVSLTHRNGRKLSSSRARQVAFLKALGETVSVAQGASLCNVGRTPSPGFASAGQEAASSNESFGVQRLMAWHRQIPFGISRLAVGTRPTVHTAWQQCIGAVRVDSEQDSTHDRCYQGGSEAT